MGSHRGSALEFVLSGRCWPAVQSSRFGGKIARVRAWVAVIVALLAGVQASACVGAAPVTCGMNGGRPHPEIGGQILYHCTDWPQPNGGIYLLNVATGAVRALIPDLAWNLDGSWSPDGSRIAFQSTRDGRDDIYVLDLASGSLRRLTDGRGFNEYPDWSPDGNWILFNSSRDGSQPGTTSYYRDLYLMRSDGSGVHRLSRHAGINADAAWNPDGERLVLMSDRSGTWDVHTMRTDGSSPEQLTHHAGSGGWAGFPRWSPEGSRIVFGSAAAEGKPYRLYWMVLGDSTPHLITPGAPGQGDVLPDWSPDGGWIVFTRIGEDTQLFAVRPDGTGLTQLTDGRGGKFLARWRPA